MSSVIGKRHRSLKFSKCHVVNAHVGSKFLAMLCSSLTFQFSTSAIDSSSYTFFLYLILHVEANIVDEYHFPETGIY